MDETDDEIKYAEALGKLPVTDDTKWVMKYIRNTNQRLDKANGWLGGIFVVVLLVLLVLLKVNWDVIT